MKIQWNVVTWYSQVTAIVLGVGIFVLGIYIGSLYQQGRVAMEIAEGLRVKQQSITEKKTERIYEITQEGNIKNIATGDIEEDDWVLLYEYAGAPALTKKLIFTTQSRCVFTGESTEFCNTSKFEQGQRVRAMGYLESDGNMIVERLEVVQ